MLKKLKLDQTKIYEQTIATYEISSMLVDFVRGRKHHLSIGAEQGDIDSWDDLISDSNDVVQNSIFDGKTPNLIITNCIEFRRLINSGELKAIRSYVKGQMRDFESVNLANIKEITG